ncbi:MAG TPA: hypothetical protein VIG74_04120 [Alphaproteobacteria bacterium]
MARSRALMPKRKPRRKSKKTTPQKRNCMADIPVQAMSIDQFSRAHGIPATRFMRC